MKRCTLSLCGIAAAVVIQAQVILVPADYPTIQQGINAAADGFTILVSPGIYVENIDFNGKNITVASLFLTTQDTSYISQTIIDGNHTGSVVTFKTGETSAAQLCGFTITNGYAYYGGGIYCYNASPELVSLVITNNIAYWHTVRPGTYCPGYGGGIWCNSNPHIDNSQIVNNYSTDHGGGIYAGSCFLLSKVRISNNTAEMQGGGIFFYDSVQFDSVNRCSIYCNEADEGNDLYSEYTCINVIVDTFTVINPTSHHASHLENFTFDILNGLFQQINADLYISPSGNNNNTGLTESEPLKTIHHATSVIISDSLHHNTIHLLEGTYSDSINGENFPVVLPDFISLVGTDRESVILDNAGADGYVIRIADNHWNYLSGMTITGGFGFASGSMSGHSVIGGGICCENSSPLFNDISVIDNNSGAGGGFYIVDSQPIISNTNISGNNCNNIGGGIFSQNSVISISNSNITVNQSSYSGGGIFCDDSFLDLSHAIVSGNNSFSAGGGLDGQYSSIFIENSIISDNTARTGGGICCYHCNDLNLTAVLITGNCAYSTNDGYGGGIYCSGSEIKLTNSTIADNSGTYSGGIEASGYSFSNITITNSILWNNNPSPQIWYWPQHQSVHGIITITHTDIEGGTQGVFANNQVTVNWLEAILNQDPWFIGTGEYPYALALGSRCIDYGTSDTTGLNLPPADLAGNMRFWDGDGDGIATIDMGAYEYGSVPVGIEIPEFAGQEAGSGLYCFPVPAANMITIESSCFDYPALMTISDLNGKNLSVLPVTGPKTVIDISSLSRGFYLVRLTHDETVATGKFIKQ